MSAGLGDFNVLSHSRPPLEEGLREGGREGVSG